MIEWHDRLKELPKNNQYVLIEVPNNPVFGWDYKQKKYDVAQFHMGKVPSPGDTIEVGDQHGNNLVPYIWYAGTKTYFGQEATRWATIE